jgi:hypothetical protein
MSTPLLSKASRYKSFDHVVTFTASSAVTQDEANSHRNRGGILISPSFQLHRHDDQVVSNIQNKTLARDFGVKMHSVIPDA